MQANICPNTPHDTHPKIISAENTLLGGLVMKMNIFCSDPKKCANHLEETSETQGGGREDPCKRASNDAPTIFLFGFSSRP